jgi:hypothetical protein
MAGIIGLAPNQAAAAGHEQTFLKVTYVIHGCCNTPDVKLPEMLEHCQVIQALQGVVLRQQPQAGQAEQAAHDHQVSSSCTWQYNMS